MSGVTSLLRVAEAALHSVDNVSSKLEEPGTEALASMLRRKNGFYAYDNALFVRPLSADAGLSGLLAWNATETWKSEYETDLTDLLMFAEDAFGNQFCMRRGEIYLFDAETADVDPVARDLDAWADAILADTAVLTGQPLWVEWQRRHGPVPMGSRLVPKRPFVLGGSFAVENLYVMDTAQSLRFRSSIANQIRNLPDGTPVSLKVE